ncbi:flavodoxin family protein [Mariniplasma anaerobium]|uniref:Flavodoxin n=1 Tax=Mariniplasma anaerobium TaxID=2735436 RepID=A0A7U9TH90_9MOLU|nr:flavodoxin [Mariniplasma anaerobium]BCR35144.1 flavodoxin [Mariniplasma anaerobium]
MSKALVLCYSFEGFTLQMANFIKEALQIEVIEIKPLNELKTKGFYKYIWGGRQVVLKKKPELSPLDVDFDLYDTIFIGSPIWAGTYAPPIRTLLEDGMLKGKKIAYFYTHEGGASKAASRAKQTIEIHNKFIGSLSILNKVALLDQNKDEIIAWSKSMLEV